MVEWVGTEWMRQPGESKKAYYARFAALYEREGGTQYVSSEDISEAAEVNAAVVEDAQKKPVLNTNHNQSSSFTSFCHVMVYHFKTQDLKANSSDKEVTDCDIYNLGGPSETNPVISFNYKKMLDGSSPSGSFDIALLPTENWSQKIRPGDWVIVWLGNGIENRSLRCLGIVNSISRNDSISPSGQRAVRFQINGSDFGRVFQRISIRYNMWLAGSILRDGLIKKFLPYHIMSPSHMITQLIKAMTGGYGNRIFSSLVEKPLRQCLIPPAMCSLFNEGSPSVSTSPHFYDIIVKNIIGTDGVVNTWVGDFFDTLWNVMYKYSNPFVNELFCEMDDTNWPDRVERPMITYRPIPLTLSDYAGSKKNVVYFKDIKGVVLDPNRVFNYSVSYDDNSRKNIIFLQATFLGANANQNEAASVVSLERGGYFNYGSIARHGQMEYVDTVPLVYPATSSGGWDVGILNKWNDLLMHWLDRAPLFENAVLDIAAMPSVRIGKRLDILSGPMLYGLPDGYSRSFYIEGYEDRWSFGSTWKQKLYLTRGIYRDKKFVERFGHEVNRTDNNFIGTTVIEK